jgi:hypothetical protein
MSDSNYGKAVLTGMCVLSGCPCCLEHTQVRGNSCNACIITCSWSRGKRFASARRLFRFGLSKANTRNEEALGDLPGATLHHPYITEAWAKLSQKLLPPNVYLNV